MRKRLPEILFAALAAVAFVGLLWLGSNLTFRGDEWGMILHAEDWSLDQLMEPHSFHWALGTRVLWNVLMIISAGVATYLCITAITISPLGPNGKYPYGLYIFGGLILLAVVVHVLRKSGQSAGTAS